MKQIGTGEGVTSCNCAKVRTLPVRHCMQINEILAVTDILSNKWRTDYKCLPFRTKAPALRCNLQDFFDAKRIVCLF